MNVAPCSAAGVSRGNDNLGRDDTVCNEGLSNLLSNSLPAGESCKLMTLVGVN